MASASLSPILAAGSRRNISTGFTIPFSPPRQLPARARTGVRAWGCLSPTELFRNTPERFAWKAILGRAPTFSLIFPLPRKVVMVEAASNFERGVGDPVTSGAGSVLIIDDE